MREPRNRVVQVRRFGGPDGLEVVDARLPTAGHSLRACSTPMYLLCAYGYAAGVQAQRRMLTMVMWIGRLYLWRWLPGGERARFYSINVMRARHPA